MARILEPIFSHSFEGKIWNIVSESSGQHLLLEVRDQQNFFTSFYIYDHTDRSFNKKAISFEEKWWIGISHFTRDLIVFHTFPETDDPSVKEFFGYNVKQSRISWTKKSMDIVSFEMNSFNAITKGEMAVRQFDLASGALMTGNPSSKTQEDTNHVQYPFHYAQGDDHFDTVREFLASLNVHHIERGVDYYEGHAVVVISYYTGGTKLDNDLLVIDFNRSILLKECLGSELSGISDRAFFIFHDTLIFVKDNTNFLSYQLPSK
ncbi:DUF4905 domain-containing protein [Fulvivirga sp. M361]|uniref:DUF4905 domain-containing protein n=1 Tax=Fulvivirga sp. M361 TaxID=2594266 RepID=UPI001627C0A8|nr:DUF4905 domain-containing protein [Fulvivirga sp. M361]